MSQIANYSKSSGGGSGTVTSVTGGTGITITGSSTVNPTVNLTIPVTIADGGTNATSFTTTDGVVYYNGTSLVTVASTGTSGQVLTSNGVGVAPTFQSGGGGGGIVTIDGTTGSVTGSTVTITGGTSGAVFTGSGTTLTESFNFLALPATTSSVGYISIGGSPYISNFNGNDFFAISGNVTTSGIENVAVGSGALEFLTTGSENTAVGYQAAIHCTSGTENCAVGMQSLNHVTSGSQNTSIGSVAGSTAGFNGSNNVLLGYEAGLSYDTTESSNIIISNSGVASESHVTRIGTQGTGSGQQSTCYVAGITGVSVSNQELVMINSSTGQLGVTANPSISAAGIMTNSAQPAFGYYLSSNTPTNLTGDGTIVALPVDTMLFDNGSNVNASTSTFTAPVAGIYLFIISSYFANLGVTHTAYDVLINTTAHDYAVGTGNPFVVSQQTFYLVQGSVLAKMSAGDTAIFQAVVFNGTKTVGFEGSFGGHAIYGYLVA
jgi:hypothetical protein